MHSLLCCIHGVPSIRMVLKAWPTLTPSRTSRCSSAPLLEAQSALSVQLAGAQRVQAVYGHNFFTHTCTRLCSRRDVPPVVSFCMLAGNISRRKFQDVCWCRDADAHGVHCCSMYDLVATHCASAMVADSSAPGAPSDVDCVGLFAP